MRRALIIVIGLALLATACGSDSNDDVATSDPTTSADDTTIPPDDPTSSDDPIPDDSVPDDSVPDDSIPDGSITPDSDDGGDASGTRPADGEDVYAIANLSVVITHPDADDVSYTISCLGDTATITGNPDGVTGEGACVALKDADVIGRLVQGTPPDRICTEQYGGPDIATITGSLSGKSVNTSIDRVNGCGIGDWDFLLAAVLPQALGMTE